MLLATLPLVLLLFSRCWGLEFGSPLLLLLLPMLVDAGRLWLVVAAGGCCFLLVAAVG